MKHVIHSATKIKYKTDGVNVWWWRSTKQAWELDNEMTPSILENIVKAGNGYITK